MTKAATMAQGWHLGAGEGCVAGHALGMPAGLTHLPCGTLMSCTLLCSLYLHHARSLGTWMTPTSWACSASRRPRPGGAGAHFAMPLAWGWGTATLLWLKVVKSGGRGWAMVGQVRCTGGCTLMMQMAVHEGIAGPLAVVGTSSKCF